MDYRDTSASYELPSSGAVSLGQSPGEVDKDMRILHTMKRLAATLAMLALAAVLVACDARPRLQSDNSSPSPARSTNPSPTEDSQVFSGMVIDSGMKGRGAELCEAGIDESNPPACAGTPLVDWDWDAVEHVEADQPELGRVVRYGEFRMRGERLEDGTIAVDIPTVTEKRPS
jgi:hypothetical protein